MDKKHKITKQQDKSKHDLKLPPLPQFQTATKSEALLPPIHKIASKRYQQQHGPQPEVKYLTNSTLNPSENLSILEKMRKDKQRLNGVSDITKESSGTRSIGRIILLDNISRTRTDIPATSKAETSVQKPYVNLKSMDYSKQMKKKINANSDDLSRSTQDKVVAATVTGKKQLTEPAPEKPRHYSNTKIIEKRQVEMPEDEFMQKYIKSIKAKVQLLQQQVDNE